MAVITINQRQLKTIKAALELYKQRLYDEWAAETYAMQCFFEGYELEDNEFLSLTAGRAPAVEHKISKFCHKIYSSEVCKGRIVWYYGGSDKATCEKCGQLYYRIGGHPDL